MYREMEEGVKVPLAEAEGLAEVEMEGEARADTVLAADMLALMEGDSEGDPWGLAEAEGHMDCVKEGRAEAEKEALTEGLRLWEPQLEEDALGEALPVTEAEGGAELWGEGLPDAEAEGESVGASFVAVAHPDASGVALALGQAEGEAERVRVSVALGVADCEAVAVEERVTTWVPVCLGEEVGEGLALGHPEALLFELALASAVVEAEADWLCVPLLLKDGCAESDAELDALGEPEVLDDAELVVESNAELVPEGQLEAEVAAVACKRRTPAGSASTSLPLPPLAPSRGLPGPRGASPGAPTPLAKPLGSRLPPPGALKAPGLGSVPLRVASKGKARHARTKSATLLILS
jgi:hypothetical protein